MFIAYSAKRGKAKGRRGEEGSGMAVRPTREERFYINRSYERTRTVLVSAKECVSERSGVKFKVN